MIVVKDLQWQTEPSQQARPSPRYRDSGWFVFLMLLGISGYLYRNLFQLPNLPILLSGDQTFFWMNGQRMLHGERPYLDLSSLRRPARTYFTLPCSRRLDLVSGLSTLRCSSSVPCCAGCVSSLLTKSWNAASNF